MARNALLDRLLNAADRMAIARGEAQWTNGYRSAREDRRKHSENIPEFSAEGARLYEKEQAQWKFVGSVEGRARQVFLAVLRDARKETALRRRASKSEGR